MCPFCISPLKIPNGTNLHAGVQTPGIRRSRKAELSLPEHGGLVWGWSGAASAVQVLGDGVFCCFPAGFFWDNPAPVHPSWSPVLDPSLENQDFPGMA